jgi:serine/threonine-protein kinase
MLGHRIHIARRAAAKPSADTIPQQTEERLDDESDRFLTRLPELLVGQYRFERELGSGGMATVYLAEDLKHHRKVAIKVLREDLAASLGATRFLREIAIVARLQHPHILPLLDSGEIGGELYYVMPFIAGQSLRDRINREGELPVQEALRTLIEVADALAYAHTLGVVHRDIKPDNVMWSGRHAVVADFGIAKAISEATGGSQVTTSGLALGTPAYMSPEQAAADPHVDHRSDIYSIGVMAYELLSGRPPFTGTTHQQILAAQVTEAPVPLGKRRASLSPELEAVVMRCLEKRPADRWQTSDDLLAALQPLVAPSGGTAPVTTKVSGSRGRGLPGWLVGGALLAGAATVLLITQKRSTPPVMTLGRFSLLTSEPQLEIHPAISPDGKFVAYAAGNSSRMRIFVKQTAGGARTYLLSDDTTAVESNPRWSPDGTHILFLSNGGVSVAPAIGGSTRVLVAGESGEVRSAAWSPDGRQIAFVRRDSLQVLAAESSETRLVMTAPAMTDLHSCAWSPNGLWIACVRGNGNATLPKPTFGNIAPSAIIIASASGGSAWDLTGAESSNQSPIWMPDSRGLLFISNRDTPFDVYAQLLTKSGRASGPPRRLLAGFDAKTISLSADGSRLAYSKYEARANLWALPIGTNGAVSTVPVALTTGSQVVEAIHVSSDGRWILYDSNLRGHSDIYRMPVAGGQPQQLTSGGGDKFAPNLSADGKLLAYHTFRPGSPDRDIEVLPLDGGPVQRVTSTPASESFPVWSPSGRAIVFLDQTRSSSGIYVVRQDSTGAWGTPVRRVADGNKPRWSSDGRWLLYRFRGVIYRVDPDSGSPEAIYRPQDGEPLATMAEWRHGDRSLLFKALDSQGRTSFWSLSGQGGRPRLVAQLNDPARQSSRPDFANDGKRLFFAIDDSQSDILVAEVSWQ